MIRRDRLGTALAVALAAAGAAGCSPDEGANGAGGATPDSGTNTPRWPACSAKTGVQTLSFVHMNDMHGHYNVELDGAPKVARIRGFYESVLAENPYTIFTNGGDDYEKGSVVEALSEYASTREVSKALRFDVRVIGNHDLAWSQEELLAYARDDHAIVLASNLEYIGDDPQGFGAVRWAELQIGCVRVGFLGAVSAPWDARNTQYQGDYYEQFPTDLDFIRVHRELVDAHRGEVDLIVAVSHLGVGDDLLVATQVEGIDAILGGHSHTTLFQPEVVGKTLVVQAGWASTYVARLDLDFDLDRRELAGHRYDLRIVTPGIEASVDTAQEVEAILQRHGPGAFESIGRMRSSSSELATCELAARAAIADLGVDAALVKRSTSFGALGLGPVTQQDLFDVFKIERQPAGTPGWTAMYVAELTGASLALLGGLPTDEWVLVAPNPIDPGRTYRLAVQKLAALHPEDYLPAGVSLSAPSFAKETWELLDQLTRARTRDCLYLDADEPLPDCKP